MAVRIWPCVVAVWVVSVALRLDGALGLFLAPQKPPMECKSISRSSPETDRIISRSVFRYEKEADVLRKAVTQARIPGDPSPTEYLSRVVHLQGLLEEEKKRPCDHNLLVDLSNAWVSVGNIPCACPPLRRLVSFTKAEPAALKGTDWRKFYLKNIVAACRGIARHWDVERIEGRVDTRHDGMSVPKLKYYNDDPQAREWRDHVDAGPGGDVVNILLTGRVLSNREYKGCGNRSCMSHGYKCKRGERCDGYDLCPSRFGGGRVNVMYDDLSSPSPLQEADVVALFGTDAAQMLFSNSVDPKAPEDSHCGRNWDVYTNQTYAVVLPEPSHVHSPMMYSRWANPGNILDVTMSFSPMWGDMHSTYVPDPSRLDELLAAPQEKTIGGVACFISSPVQSNGRIGYVSELMKYINVTSYGALLNNAQISGDCSKTGMTAECRTDAKMLVMPKHKFILAFENGNEYDYVTEKVYEVLQAGAVPVYMGAPNIDRFVPPSSIIRTDDFKGPMELAEYLHRLLANETLYNSYLEWKKHPLPDSLVALSEETSSRWNLCRLAAAHRARMRSPVISSINSIGPRVRIPQTPHDALEGGHSILELKWHHSPAYVPRYKLVAEGMIRRCYRMLLDDSFKYMAELMAADAEYRRAVQKSSGLALCWRLPVSLKDTVSDVVERALLQTLMLESLGELVGPFVSLFILGREYAYV